MELLWSFACVVLAKVDLGSITTKMYTHTLAIANDKSIPLEEMETRLAKEHEASVASVYSHTRTSAHTHTYHVDLSHLFGYV